MSKEKVTLPKAFVNRMKKLLGEEYNSFIESYENSNYKGLRINTLKCVSDEERKKVLDTFGISDAVPWADNGYYYDDKERPGKHPYHEAGVYYIQEPSAMSAAALLCPKEGERVLDLCAAPGGKTTQLSTYLNQKGILISNEINSGRAKILSQNVERMGIANCIVTNEDSDTLSEVFPEFFDKILIDAPCSGEGMFRKNSEACNEWSEENVRLCAKRQGEILENGAKMLKNGGTIVYSTCTFAPEENEQTISDFLEIHSEFSVLKPYHNYFSEGIPGWGDGNERLKATSRLWPHKLKGEGHFVAVLKKEINEIIETDERNGRKRCNGKGKNKISGNKLTKADRLMLEEFLKEALSDKVSNEILNGKLMFFGEQLYLLPDDAPDIAGVKVLRAGLHIGTRKKGRFEPSHSLALYLKKEDVKRYVSYEAESEEIKAYLHGETIIGEVDKGWCLVCVDGYSLGFGKASGGQIKNHYPKGLRI